MLHIFLDGCPRKITFKANPTDAEIKEADLVIAAVSTNDEEGFNRSFALHPQTGGGLAERCVSLNSKTILISMTGGAFRMTDFQDKVAAHLFALFLGQTQGRALVDVLMGRVNPSGKLPFTCEKEFSDSPAFQYPAVDLVSQPIKPDSGKGARIDYKEGIFVGYRWYEHQKVAPLYPFGFGLSYATFLYDHLKLKSLSLSQNQSLTLSFTITNEGKVEGTEIAQLYLREIQCTVPRPEKELKGFQKIKLKPGETKTIQMTITPQDLAFWDDKSHAWKIEEGDFQVLIGPSSVETPLTSSFTFKN
ncbi:MAG: glycoside hydrolase family 3 C-terminal domain-containing protein [Verrucomicrobiota bacterium]